MMIINTTAAAISNNENGYHYSDIDLIYTEGEERQTKPRERESKPNKQYENDTTRRRKLVQLVERIEQQNKQKAEIIQQTENRFD